MIKVDANEGMVSLEVRGSSIELMADMCCILKSFMDTTENKISLDDIVRNMAYFDDENGTVKHIRIKDTAEVLN